MNSIMTRIEIHHVVVALLVGIGALSTGLAALALTLLGAACSL